MNGFEVFSETVRNLRWANSVKASQREHAKVIGVSVRVTHYVITALVGKGLAKLCNFTSADEKRRYAIFLHAEGSFGWPI